MPALWPSAFRDGEPAIPRLTAFGHRFHRVENAEVSYPAAHCGRLEIGLLSRALHPRIEKTPGTLYKVFRQEVWGGTGGVHD